MALELILDTVSNGEVQQSLHSGASRIVRSGIVKGLTTALTTSKLALWDALVASGAPALGDTFTATGEGAGYYLMHRISRGIEDTSGKMARIWLHYEKLGGGGSPIERFAAEDGISLVNEETELDPASGKPLMCSTKSTSPAYNGIERDEWRPITVNYPRRMRALVLFGLFADRPSDAVKNAGGCVNNSTWQGMPRGYWRCEGAKVRYSSRDGMYTVTVPFLSKGTGAGNDWSTYKRAVDGTGKKISPSSTLMTTLRTDTYEYGIRYDKDAIWKAGFYPVSNFSAIFGDTFPIGD